MSYIQFIQNYAYKTIATCYSHPTEKLTKSLYREFGTFKWGYACGSKIFITMVSMSPNFAWYNI